MIFMEDKRVVGIVAGTDKLEANVVIAADGAVSYGREGGSWKFLAKEFAIGMKEIMNCLKKLLRTDSILPTEEGAAQLFIGQCTRQIPGGAFVFIPTEQAFHSGS